MYNEIIFFLSYLSSSATIPLQMSWKAHQWVKTLLKINLFRTDKYAALMETLFVEFYVSVSNYTVIFLHFR